MVRTRKRFKLNDDVASGYGGGKAGRAANAIANAQISERGYSDRGYHGMMVGEPPDPTDIPAYISQTNTPLFLVRPKMAEEIFSLIQKGNYVQTVCRAVGIHYNTFISWLRRGYAGESLVYYEFYMNVRRAEGLSEADRVAQIVKHGHVKWQANAWMLERRYPDTWGRRDVIDHNVKNQTNINITVRKELAGQVIDDVESRDLARQLISRTKHNT